MPNILPAAKAVVAQSAALRGSAAVVYIAERIAV
jgi:hypothetical protein